MQEFQELYEKYSQYVYHFMLKLTNSNPDLADELTQETFFQVYLSLPKYKGDSSILTWICGIAKNICRRHYKKNPITVEFEKIEFEFLRDGEFITMEEKAEQKDMFLRIVQEIMKLKEKYRDVLIYRLFLDMSFHEIAEIMGIKENSAKVIYHRGKNMIRGRMEEYKNE
ncbi:RNA polymerase sigma factor [Blautia sp.]|uniref:RNA polymerase sigma factor n=1 Tax=Blautia sp. TaxID=1955243 RepID=UPI00258B58A8|nr:RNA polymerase sigma factor [Blautia sp.]